MARKQLGANASGATDAITAAGSQTLTNKTIAAGSNTITGLGIAALSGITGTANNTTFLRGDGQWATPSGGGDASTNTSTTTANQLTLFADTSGKLLGAASGTGIAKLTSGVLSTVTAPSGTIVGTSDNQTLTTKTIALGSNTISGSASDFNTALTGADFYTTGGTDVAITDGGTGTSSLPSGILKGAGTGAITAAAAGTDYQAPITLTTTGISGAATFASNTLNIPQYSGGTLAPARVTTVGTETYTVTLGAVTQISGTTIDGVTIATGDRVLVNDAPASSGVGSPGSTQPGNGVYSATTSGGNILLARVADMTGTVAPAGLTIFVEAGTLGAGSGFMVSTPSSGAAFTYNTNNISWTKFAGSPTGGVGKYSTLIGDSVTTAIAVTHNLGTQDVTWSIRDATTNEFIDCDVVSTSTTTITFTFATAPASNAYRVVVVG